jgi:hypothetical protein
MRVMTSLYESLAVPTLARPHDPRTGKKERATDSLVSDLAVLVVATEGAGRTNITEATETHDERQMLYYGGVGL